MREILFRGKNFDGNWVEGGFVQGEGYGGEHECYIMRSVTSFIFDDYSYDEVDPDTVSEYTGLRDKNGKRIFEGDIINYEDGDPSDYEYHDGTVMNVGEIIFCDGKFCFTNAVSVTMDDLLCDNNMLDCEVIGNKWDNPELLEG